MWNVRAAVLMENSWWNKPGHVKPVKSVLTLLVPFCFTTNDCFDFYGRIKTVSTLLFYFIVPLLWEGILAINITPSGGCLCALKLCHICIKCISFLIVPNCFWWRQWDGMASHVHFLEDKVNHPPKQSQFRWISRWNYWQQKSLILGTKLHPLGW